MMTSVKIEKANLSHAEGIAKQANNLKICLHLRRTWPLPYLKEHAIEFINTMDSSDSDHLKTIIYNNEVVGVIGLHKTNEIENEREIGFWIGEAFWGKGITTKAIKLMVKYAFDELKLNRIYSYANVGNEASKYAQINAGFTETGIVTQECKPSEIRDQYTFEYLKEDYFKAL